MENNEIASKIIETHGDKLSSYHSAILAAMLGQNLSLNDAFREANGQIPDDDDDYKNKNDQYLKAADDIDEWIKNLGLNVEQ